MIGGLSEFEAVIRLVLAFFLGAALGLERESHDRPAGLRTFILVSVGSTLIMIVSLSIREIYGTVADPGRIAAQVVTGIGFLGAGTILHEGPFIRGLTTAAGLWVVAAIGLAIGSGFYLIAIVGTALALITLTLLGRVERAYIGVKGHGLLTVVTADPPGQLGRISSALGDKGVDIRDIRITPQSEGVVEIELRVKAPSAAAIREAIQSVARMPEVRSTEYSG